MASSPGSRSSGRGFLEATVGLCHVQTPGDRYGDPKAPQVIRDRQDAAFQNGNWMESDSEDEFPASDADQITTENPWSQPGPVPLEQMIPTTQHHRNNLTALSQKYNLYFTTYGNRIFVYRPTSVPDQPLTREPELILATSPDGVGVRIRPSQDPYHPHQANAMRTGFLGLKEILALVYDDGAVFAFYIDQIAAYVENKALGRTPGLVPTPFFRDNAGSSAWGLAIHQTSRLIAVSSNQREVTVFAFGLSHHVVPPKKVAEQNLAAKYISRRKRTCRILLLLGAGADNIPNISFWDDKDGNAEKICAIDIRGAVWILNIWKPFTAPLRIPTMQDGTFVAGGTGWDILVLPHTSFVASTAVSDALGMPEAAIRPVNGKLDMTESLSRVCDNPVAFDPVPVWTVAPPAPFNFPPTPMPAHPMMLQGGLPPLMPAVVHPGPGVVIMPMTPVPAPVPAPAVEQTDSDSGSALSEEGDDGDDGMSNFQHLFNEPLPGSFPIGSLLASVPGGGDGDIGSPEQDTGGSESSASPEPQLHGAAAGPGVWPPFFGSSGSATSGSSASSNSPPQPPGSVGAGAGPTLSFPISGFPPFPIGLRPIIIQPKPPQVAALAPSEDGYFNLLDIYPDEIIYLPNRGAVLGIPTAVKDKLKFFQRPIERSSAKATQDLSADRLSRCAILRTYDEDIELVNMEPDVTNVMCRKVVGQPEGNLLANRATHRLNMTLHVPELSLIIIGSPMGRVVLITPTRIKGEGVKLQPGTATPQLKYGFRVDWVLPRAREEQQRLGRRSPLYGIAVAPAPEAGDPVGRGSLLLRKPASRRKTATGPGTRRYRLILQFHNHMIITYEISRDGDGALQVF